MSNPKAQIEEIHYLRAIGCLLVLLVHVSASFFYQQGKFNDFTYFINQISRFGTPFFALISGFLLFNQSRRRGFHFQKFVSSRFTKIVVPFLVWSVFYLAFLYIDQGINPFLDGLEAFLINFVFGNSFYHLYFISIVLQFYFIFPLLQGFRSRKSWVVLLAASAFINLYFNKSYTPPELEGVMISQRDFLPSWIFFFIFGGFLAHFWEPLFRFAKRYQASLGILSILITALAVVEYHIAGSIASNRPTNLINIPILTLFVLGVGRKIAKIKWLSIMLKKIGNLSMSIYLVHPFVLYMFQKFAPESLWKTTLFPIILSINSVRHNFYRMANTAPAFQSIHLNGAENVQ
ncbi:acyltransferase [Bacillus sp. V5-8f]|uniref:acyltransferase n=1 Tax=Bacillus sp. V5-8f TaxID=2053044 RepID=UPI002155AF22|nr:acyltransferase [Bacillus sp. V5-8f]